MRERPSYKGGKLQLPILLKPIALSQYLLAEISGQVQMMHYQKNRKSELLHSLPQVEWADYCLVQQQPQKRRG